MTMTEQLMRLIQHHGVDFELFFQPKLKKCFILAFAIIFLVIPAACSALTDEAMGNGDEKISLTIISPDDEDEVWLDVIPLHLGIVGEVSSPFGIRRISVSGCSEEVIFNNGTRFFYSVPVSQGQNTITVIAEDNLGNTVEKTINVTINLGMPPPPLITISGKVTDIRGIPLSDVMVIFESKMGLTADHNPISAINVTGNDGSYLIEDAIGYQHTIKIQKEGYLTYESEAEFENLTNEFNLKLISQSMVLMGFFLLLIILCIGIVIILKRNG